MKIISGKIKKPQKVVIYGPEGIGKSTFASKFPSPVFIDTEGSTKEMDVDRFEKPLSWSEFGSIVKDFINDHGSYKTLVIDTADWAEMLCTQYVCSKYQKKGVEDFGYGKGYVYVQEEFGKLLNFLEQFIDAGLNVVVTAHAKMRKFEQPDESGAYDRWELKLSKGVAPLLKEWADMVLFANYKTYIVKDDNDKVKAKGGQRVMYTSHHVCWDAKNRHELPEEVPFDYSSIAHCIPLDAIPVTVPEKQKETMVQEKENRLNEIIDDTPEKPAEPETVVSTQNSDIPQELLRLMQQHGITEHDIQVAVANNGYYPADMPVAQYDKAFIEGKLIAGWESFHKAVLYYKQLPFSGANK
ncbi:MAG: ATP-binding protein [Clostridia bacterium]|nr:ATP-binding protein [Clostridia bacterium]